ncbi:TolC family protein [Anaeromyxobacter diazotrophicus]|uniref:Outer membrane efflux protein n=1 Tax=Anaeromyxobacter diazotrophicus TaxID=2590199 RepID=A0A7I9VHF5_9BACT|nr:TolC family protein [Anaeromyxobacter diazotrophicus]GEJ55814.1 outer membrane efflux protein [Anaeromyxobacter diazotrophicus]
MIAAALILAGSVAASDPTPTSTSTSAATSTATSTAAPTSTATETATSTAYPAEPVTFDDAVRRAGARSPQALIAAQELRRAGALLTQTRAAALPFLGANASYTRLDAARRTAGSTAPLVARDSLNANLSLQLPLLAPSRWSVWAHAAEQVEVARASEADVRRQVVLATARAYLSALAQKRVVEVSRSARDIARARFDFARARRVGGIGNAVDELRAEQQLAASEVQLANGEVGVVRAQEALGVLTGSPGPLDAAQEPDFHADPAQARDAEARRLDARAAEARRAAAEHVRRDSWLDWLPTLTATAQPFYNDPATVTAPRTGWQVQFLLSLPLFEGGLRVGQLREREALEREAQVSLEGTLLQVRSDVRVALAEVARQEAALESARRAADRARSVLQLTTEAYRAGASNDLDVTTAQQQSRDADLQAVIAEDAVRQARLDLLAGSGQFP